MKSTKANELGGAQGLWAPTRRLLQAMLQYRGLVVVTVVLAVVLAGMAPLRPWYIQQAVDGPMRTGDLDALAGLGWLILGLLVLESLLRYGFGYLSVQLGQSVVLDLRQSLYTKLSRYRPGFYEARPVGSLASRVINDLEAIAELFAQGFLTMAGDVLQLVVVLVVMFSTDWQLSVVSLLVMPLLLRSTWWFKEKVHGSFTSVRANTARLNAFLAERLSNLLLVPLFDREKRENQAFAEENARLTKAHLDGIWYYSVFFPVVEVLTAAAMGLMVWYGAVRVESGDVSPGVLVAFLVYINQLFRPLRLLADKFNSLQMGVIAASRVFALMEEEAEVQVQVESTGTGLPKAENGRRGLHVKISDLYFGYDPERPVLRGLNLELNQGEVVAVVGGSGCGKSTLAQLLVRFYDANSGRIEINGRNLEAYPLQELRHRMVYVPQELFLINGTVLDNIALLNTGLDGPTVESRIRSWNLEEFLDKLPQGLDTPVGERGLLLSAGQRQLVALMRAMVLDPDLLILDEATASIDSKTEAMVQRGIESFVQGRNALLIAHRLSTLRFAHRIVVLEGGVVVESGTYNALLELKGRFWALHQAQQVDSGASQPK
ncbi:MAG: hypothetical protein RIT39_1046 [Bacteroidota bacterium]|jgi:ATP-binding cassette subfamily B protein